MGRKKAGIFAVVVIIIALVAGGIWYIVWGGGLSGNSADKVYVESVASLNGVSSGAQNRFSGKVEPQQSWEINKNSDKTIKEIFVEEGEVVEEGTPLFEYGTEDTEQQIAQAKLDLEGIDNEISDYKNQIKDLETERSAVSEDEKFQYTTQIQSTQTLIKQAEYSKESKKVEIENLESTVENSVVESEIAGVIKSISESGYDPNTGEELAFMTVLATGDYRVKGTINEQNVWTLTEGQPVIIRSRIDEAQTWTGSITEIDTNNEVKNNNGNYYDTGSSETATKYPFYISLDSMEDLILGQHVFIEMDYGQEEEKEGIWLYESYIVMEGLAMEEELFPEGDPSGGEMFMDEELSGEDMVPGEDPAEEDMLLDEEQHEGEMMPEEDLPEAIMPLEDKGEEDLTEGGILPESELSEEEPALEGEAYEVGTSEVAAYVWADNGHGKLEKRTVELGEYDPNTGTYEILSGLTEEDYIAYPMEALYEGVTTVKDASEVDYSSPMYNEGEPDMEEGMEGFDGAMENGGEASMEDMGEFDGAMENGGEASMEDMGGPDGGIMESPDDADIDFEEPEVAE